MASNGDTSSIQSIVPNVSCCKQTVNVLDQTNPQCGKYDTTRLNATNNINVSFGRGSCFRSTINVTIQHVQWVIFVLQILQEVHLQQEVDGKWSECYIDQS